KLSAKLTSVNPAANSIGNPPWARGPCITGPRKAAGSLDGEDDANHLGEEGDAFDQRRRDDHRGADVARRGRLAGGALHRGCCESADAEAGAEDGESGPETRGQIAKRELVHGSTSHCMDAPSLGGEEWHVVAGCGPEAA